MEMKSCLKNPVLMGLAVLLFASSCACIPLGRNKRIGRRPGMVQTVDYELWWWSVAGFDQLGPHDTEWKWENRGGVMRIAFEGSISNIDWMQNFDFIATSYEERGHKLYAHKGILTKFLGIREEIKEVVRREDPDVVILSGFSQGAGIAVLCHLCLRLWFPEILVETHAFGSPKLFWHKNLGEVDHLFGNLNLYIIESDVVPQQPPDLFGFRRVGHVETWKPIRDFWDVYWNHNTYGIIIEGLSKKKKR